MSTSTDQFANPLARKTPLGGPAGVAIASIIPLTALVLFLVFGALGGWSWSWIILLAIPVSGIAVYGLGGRRNARN